MAPHLRETGGMAPQSGVQWSSVRPGTQTGRPKAASNSIRSKVSGSLGTCPHSCTQNLEKGQKECMDQTTGRRATKCCLMVRPRLMAGGASTQYDLSSHIKTRYGTSKPWHGHHRVWHRFCLCVLVVMPSILRPFARSFRVIYGPRTNQLLTVQV